MCVCVCGSLNAFHQEATLEAEAGTLLASEATAVCLAVFGCVWLCRFGPDREPFCPSPRPGGGT